jgi:hypothetical protein
MSPYPRLVNKKKAPEENPKPFWLSAFAYGL